MPTHPSRMALALWSSQLPSRNRHDVRAGYTTAGCDWVGGAGAHICFPSPAGLPPCTSYLGRNEQSRVRGNEHEHTVCLEALVCVVIERGRAKHDGLGRVGGPLCGQRVLYDKRTIHGGGGFDAVSGEIIVLPCESDQDDDPQGSIHTQGGSGGGVYAARVSREMASKVSGFMPATSVYLPRLHLPPRTPRRTVSRAS